MKKISAYRLRCQEIVAKKFVLSPQGYPQKTDKPHPARFNFSPLFFNTIEGLFGILSTLRHDPHSTIIRGSLKQGFSPNNQYRRKIDNPDKAGYVATVEEVDRDWICIDIDNYRCKTTVDPLNKESLIQAAKETLYAHLPQDLHNTSFVVQWSNSAFLDSKTYTFDPHKAKAHFWIMLDREVCGESLRPWLKAIGADSALADTIQQHYTSDPVCEGFTHPLPSQHRVFLVNGERDTLDTTKITTHEIFTTEQYKQRLEQEAQRKLQEAKEREERHAKQEQEQRSTYDVEGSYTSRKALAESILNTAIRKIMSARDGNKGKTIFGQSKWIASIASEHRNGLSTSYAQTMLESAAVNLAGQSAADLRDYRVSYKNGWSEGESSPQLLDLKVENKPQKITKAKKNKEQKEKATQEKIQNSIFYHYANLSAAQAPCGFSPTPHYMAPLHVTAGITAVRASLGTGKTEVAKALCKKYPSVLWLAHRVALTRNTQERLNEGETQAFSLYLDKEGKLVESKLIVCVDSISRVASQHDLVVIDEADQVLRSVIKRSKNRQASDAIFHKMMGLTIAGGGTKQILLLSADLCDTTLKAYEVLFGKEVTNRIDHNWHHPDETWNFHETIDLWRLQLSEDLENNKKIFGFFASQATLIQYEAWIKQHFPSKKVVAIHREAEDEDRDTLESVNKLWKDADVVFVTTSAGSGVSYDVKDDFDAVYVNGYHAPLDFPASEYLQGACRVRHPRSRTVQAYIIESERSLKTLEAMRGEFERREGETLRILRSIGQIEEIRGAVTTTAQIFENAWLLAMLQGEERSHFAAKWICETLLDRQIKITYTTGVGDPKKSKKIQGEMQVAKEAVFIKEIGRILDAKDLTPAEAEPLRGQELKKAQQLEIKKHEAAMFYSEHEDKHTAPEAPTEEILVWDNKGKARKTIRSLVTSAAFHAARDYNIFQDQHDLVFDTSDKEAKVYPKIRSKMDASHYYLRSKQGCLLLAVACKEIPEFHKLLLEFFPNALPSTLSHVTTEEVMNAYFKDVRAYGKVFGTRVSEHNNFASNLGQICSDFGIVRTSIRAGGGPRDYIFEEKLTRYALEQATYERNRYMTAIEKWKNGHGLVDTSEFDREEGEIKEEHKQVQMFAQYPQQPAVQQNAQASVQTTTQDDLGRHVGYLMCCYMNGAKQGPFDAFVYTKKKLGIQDLNYAWALECKTAFDNSFWG